MEPVRVQPITLRVPENFVEMARALDRQPLSTWVPYITKQDRENEDAPLLEVFLSALQVAEYNEPYNPDITRLIQHAKKTLQKRCKDLTKVYSFFSVDRIRQLQEVVLNVEAIGIENISHRECIELQPLALWAKNIVRKDAELNGHGAVLTEYSEAIVRARNRQSRNRDIIQLRDDAGKELEKRKIRKKVTKEFATEDAFIAWTKTHIYTPDTIRALAKERKEVVKNLSLIKKFTSIVQPEPSISNVIQLPTNQDPTKSTQIYHVSKSPQMLQEALFFWENVISSGSKTIVSLSEPDKKSKGKAFPYWDMGESYWNFQKLETQTHTIKRCTAKILLEDEKGSRIRQHLFRIQNKYSREGYIVEQLQYDGWKDDYKALDKQLLTELVLWVTDADREEGGPITLHATEKTAALTFLMSHALLDKTIGQQRRDRELRINIFKYIFQAMRQTAFFDSKVKLIPIVQTVSDVLGRLMHEKGIV